MFMHDNKNEYLSKSNAERVSSASLPGGARNNRSTGRITENHMFSFRPHIVPKSRNLADNYKRTFADVFPSIPLTFLETYDPSFRPLSSLPR